MKTAVAFRFTESSSWQALMLFRRLAADARAQSADARPSSAVIKDGADVWILAETVARPLGTRQKVFSNHDSAPDLAEGSAMIRARGLGGGRSSPSK